VAAPARERERRRAFSAPDSQRSRDADGVNILVAILTLVLCGAVLVVLSAPFRAARARAGATDAPAEAHRRSEPDAVLERDELEAAREAKYREIRDAELDYRTGKLSREDYEAIDGALRGEAVEILNRLAALGGEPADADGEPD